MYDPPTQASPLDNPVEVELQKQRDEVARKAEKRLRRKNRPPSPDIIPNPPGVSYGMDLAYFGADSSDSDETTDEETNVFAEAAAREAAARKEAERKLEINQAWMKPMRRARAIQAEAKAKAEAEALAEAEKVQVSAPVTPVKAPIIITNDEGTFKVPSPGSSESDPEDSPQATSPLQGYGKDAPRVLQSILKSSPSKGKAPETWKKPPPPRPTPSHAALPVSVGTKELGAQSSSSQSASVSRPSQSSTAPPLVNISTDSEALRKARQKAQQYQPRRPSTLRETSRINSSPISAAGDEDESAAKAILAGKENQVVQTSPEVKALGDANSIESYDHFNQAVTSKVSSLLADTSIDPESIMGVFEHKILSEDGQDVENKISSEDGQDAVIPPERCWSPPLVGRFYEKNPKIEAYLDSIWTPEHDARAGAAFTSDFERYLEVQAKKPPTVKRYY